MFCKEKIRYVLKIVLFNNYLWYYLEPKVLFMYKRFFLRMRNAM